MIELMVGDCLFTTRRLFAANPSGTHGIPLGPSSDPPPTDPPGSVSKAPGSLRERINRERRPSENVDNAQGGPSFADILSGGAQRSAIPSVNQNTLDQPKSDLDELKSMMKGLMEQMGTMMNLLTTIVSKMT